MTKQLTQVLTHDRRSLSEQVVAVAGNGTSALRPPGEVREEVRNSSHQTDKFTEIQ
ncbi:hypothetical protein [Streptomyces sp. enrichment culture]|uniref:hypothetical protein n=1 Tax=Streptomyces sp. enrichment culture TaxID=1795815 RepID=UPI003F55B729